LKAQQAPCRSSTSIGSVRSRLATGSPRSLQVPVSRLASRDLDQATPGRRVQFRLTRSLTTVFSDGSAQVTFPDAGPGVAPHPSSGRRSSASIIQTRSLSSSMATAYARTRPLGSSSSRLLPTTLPCQLAVPLSRVRSVAETTTRSPRSKEVEFNLPKASHAQGTFPNSGPSG
jgi:hypothetical protein